MSPYRPIILRVLRELGRVADPRHVEAYMRLEHPTLDGLSPSAFLTEVELSVACIDAGGLLQAERCARSYGL